MKIYNWVIKNIVLLYNSIYNLAKEYKKPRVFSAVDFDK